MLMDLIKLDGIGYLMESSKHKILSTAYLAPIGYYSILMKYPNSEIEQFEYFIKQSIRNRCNIYGANGKLRLTVPKERNRSSKTLIKDIRVSYETDWQKIHWKSISSAYQSSSYFEFYEHLLYPLYAKKVKFLLDLNTKLQKIIFDCLQSKDQSSLTTKFDNNINKENLRNFNFNVSNQQAYKQVFENKFGFIPNLSILDLLFNLGPESNQYLNNVQNL